MSALKNINKRNKNYVLSVVLVLLFAFGGAIDNDYILNILITTAFFASMSCAWNIMCGSTGYFSFGHVAFMGIGQYATTLLYVRCGISPWIGMLVGVLISLALALLIGLLSLRLKEFYFTISTQALAIIISILVVKFEPITGGSTGCFIPYNPGFANMIFSDIKYSYFMMLLVLLAVLLVSSYIRESRLGYNLISIQGNELASASLGVDVVRSKLVALCVSAVFTSIAGTIYSQYTLFVDPATAFSLLTSEKIAIMSIIGGLGTVFGPLIGGIIMTPVEIFLRGWIGNIVQGSYLVIYGIVLILAVLYMPDGFIGLFRKYVTGRRKRKETGTHKKPDRIVKESSHGD